MSELFVSPAASGQLSAPRARREEQRPPGPRLIEPAAGRYAVEHRGDVMPPLPRCYGGVGESSGDGSSASQRQQQQFQPQQQQFQPQQQYDSQSDVFVEVRQYSNSKSEQTQASVYGVNAGRPTEPEADTNSNYKPPAANDPYDGTSNRGEEQNSWQQLRQNQQYQDSNDSPPWKQQFQQHHQPHQLDSDPPPWARQHQHHQQLVTSLSSPSLPPPVSPPVSPGAADSSSASPEDQRRRPGRRRGTLSSSLQRARLARSCPELSESDGSPEPRRRARVIRGILKNGRRGAEIPHSHRGMSVRGDEPVQRRAWLLWIEARLAISLVCSNLFCVNGGFV